MIKLYITSAVVLTALAIGQFVQATHDTQLSKMRRAQIICDIGHNEINGATEEACGRALDDAKAIYTCNYNGNSCHVEGL